MYVVWNRENQFRTKEYGTEPLEVISETPDFYRVKDKWGRICSFYKYRFDVVTKIVELEELL
jgi:hypothetical protein